ncbi:MAG: rRNA maturation RNase YbeY [Actinobacteria bacterium]|nr:rRNA maturation RNase YbeY [Actinomycetota bacterium]
MESDSQPVVAVTVLNETDAPIDVDSWADLVRNALAAEGVVAPAETNVVFVDADTIAELNSEHMGKDGPTDVLSFPIDDEWDDAFVMPGEIRFVGDIVLCPEVAERNASEHAGTTADEIALLLIHGTLHLLGHDHGEPEERALMWATEQRLMAELWRPLSRNPWQDS